MSMHWEDIVSHLAPAQPALVVDRGRRLRYLNTPMQDLLGWRGEELTARGWIATCVLARDRPVVEQLVADGMNGAASDGDLSLITRDGRRLAMHVGLTRQTNGRARALVVVARDVRESDGSIVPTWDCSCDVSRAPDSMGLVRAMRFLDASRDASTYIGQPLGVILSELGCTAVDRAVNTLLDPQCPDLAHVALVGADRVFCLIMAHPMGDEVRITVRYMNAELLPALLETKVKRIADRSGLSDRERQVLQLLLRGRGLEDIATILEIAPRTVKFHQANVLQKLGADSRLDLLRVVL